MTIVNDYFEMFRDIYRYSGNYRVSMVAFRLLSETIGGYYRDSGNYCLTYDSRRSAKRMRSGKDDHHIRSSFPGLR